MDIDPISINGRGAHAGPVGIRIRDPCGCQLSVKGAFVASSAHQRKSVCVKGLVGAASVVCPCIAVMGLMPTARNRVAETTGGAAHDERRDHGCLNAAEGSPRPPLDGRARQAAARRSLRCRVPWVARSGSHARPVVMTPCRCRRIAAAITVWACVGVSLLRSRVVRCR
jgi:hypothetical protein